jgi:hypothetical protein
VSTGVKIPMICSSEKRACFLLTSKSLTYRWGSVEEGSTKIIYFKNERQVAGSVAEVQ